MSARILRPLTVALVSSLAALAGCNWEQARFKQTRELMVDHQPLSPLDVETENGAIDIRLAEGEAVEIDAHLKAVSQERLDATEILASRLDDGTLYLRVRWPEGGRRSNEGCSFDIRVPDARGATLRSSNGALTLAGIEGDARLKTSNGRIRVENHRGDASAESSNGRIELIQIAGEASAHTSNGRVVIELADDSAGPVSVQTSNGAVEVSVGPAFDGLLGARTSNGSVSLTGFEDENIRNRGKGSCTVQAGSGELAGGESTIRSSNGSIRLTRRAG